MKVSKESYAKIKSNMKTLLYVFDKKKISFLPHITKENTKPYVWNLWHIISDQKHHVRNDGRFNEGVVGRVFTYDEKFVLYPDDTNDKTLSTALVKAFKEILAEGITQEPVTNW